MFTNENWHGVPQCLAIMLFDYLERKKGLVLKNILNICLILSAWILALKKKSAVKRYKGDTGTGLNGASWQVVLQMWLVPAKRKKTHVSSADDEHIKGSCETKIIARIKTKITISQLTFARSKHPKKYWKLLRGHREILRYSRTSLMVGNNALLIFYIFV